MGAALSLLPAGTMSGAVANRARSCFTGQSMPSQPSAAELGCATSSADASATKVPHIAIGFISSPSRHTTRAVPRSAACSVQPPNFSPRFTHGDVTEALIHK